MTGSFESESLLFVLAKSFVLLCYDYFPSLNPNSIIDLIHLGGNPCPCPLHRGPGLTQSFQKLLNLEVDCCFDLVNYLADTTPF